MKVTFRKSMWRGAAALLAGMMVGLTGCASSGGSGSSGGETTGQKRSDDEIAKEVRKQLSSDPSFKYPDVQAYVYEGDVQLGGFVETPEQRQRAAELASHVKGANQVINEILLKPPSTGTAPIESTAPAEAQPSPKK